MRFLLRVAFLALCAVELLCMVVAFLPNRLVKVCDRYGWRIADLLADGRRP